MRGGGIAGVYEEAIKVQLLGGFPAAPHVPRRRGRSCKCRWVRCERRRPARLTTRLKEEDVGGTPTGFAWRGGLGFMPARNVNLRSNKTGNVSADRGT